MVKKLKVPPEKVREVKKSFSPIRSPMRTAKFFWKSWTNPSHWDLPEWPPQKRRMTEAGSLTPELRRRLVANTLTDEDCIILTAVVDNYAILDRAVKEKSGKIRKLLKMIFGATTEKAEKVLNLPPKPKDEKRKPKGHGRNGACAYTGKKVAVSHTLHSGDTCPGCEKGKLYAAPPGVTVRITGNAPLDACVWEQEKLRCNLCGEAFTAKLPHETGPEKYDASAGAMIALLKYGCGVPFNRLETLQDSLGVPLPASTQWDIVEKNADRAHPAYKELIRQAAQGEIIHNDDTTMKILASVNEGERSGTFTTGILCVTKERKIALFFTGHKHAGENLTDLLRQRHPDRGPPIQMCDGLLRNLPKEFVTLLSNCLSHGRRNFIDVLHSFPEECRSVIEVLATVYKNDATAKEKKMTPGARLDYHQANSGPHGRSP